VLQRAALFERLQRRLAIPIALPSAAQEEVERLRRRVRCGGTREIFESSACQ